MEMEFAFFKILVQYFDVKRLDFCLARLQEYLNKLHIKIYYILELWHES